MANNQQVEFLTPVGRLVQGSPWILNETDREGKPLVTQDGKPKKQCFFAIAIEKTNPEWPAFWARLAQVAQGGYPQFFNPQGQCIKPDFAWKVADGDGIDADGKPNNAKPGWAGHWVVRFSSSFLPRCFEKGKYAAHQQLSDERSIKPGFFVRVGGLMQANIGSKKPGLYLNADLVELNFVGEEIVFGRDAGAALGAQQSTYVPQGAVQLGMQQPPMGGVPNAPMGMSPQQAAAPMGMQPQTMPANAGGMPAMGAPGFAQQPQNPMATVAPMNAVNPGMMQPHGMPGTAVTPNTGFVQGAMQAAGVPQPGMMPTPAAQPVLQPTPKAQGYTVEQFLANGFNVEQLINEGYFVRVG